MNRALSFPYAFVLMNWAAVVSLYQFWLNRNDCNKVWVKYASHSCAATRHVEEEEEQVRAAA